MQAAALIRAVSRTDRWISREKVPASVEYSTTNAIAMFQIRVPKETPTNHGT